MTDERKETVAEIVAHLRSETGDDGLSRADVLYLANAIEAAHDREIAEKDAENIQLTQDVAALVIDTEAIRSVAGWLRSLCGSEHATLLPPRGFQEGSSYPGCFCTVAAALLKAIGEKG